MRIKSRAVSGLMLMLLLVIALTLTFNIQPAKASGTIYIRTDGSIDPPSAPISSVDNTTYTLTGNIYDSIVVQRDSIVVDGAGYIVQGTYAYWSIGIDLTERSNVTVKNATIKTFDYGVYLYNSLNNKIVGNNVTNNSGDGVRLVDSSNNTIYGNSVAKNSLYGIPLYGSLNNTIHGNDIVNNAYGILLTYYSRNNTVYENRIANNSDYGISIYGSITNNVYGNNITNNHYGIGLDYTDPYPSKTPKNLIWGNNIANNWYGIRIVEASNNSIYHNNFFSNSMGQVYLYPTQNIWDNGYSSGGNYWSDYTGVDVKSGTNQNQPSSDGIGDTALVIDANNTDHYPLMYPGGTAPPPSYTLTIHSSPTGVTFTVDGVPRTTPWSGTYTEGASVNLEMPAIHEGHVWDHWSDGDTNRIKTVTMSTDIALTGLYVPPGGIGGKATPINKIMIEPMNNLELFAPYIGLTILLTVAASTVVYVKKRKRIEADS